MNKNNLIEKWTKIHSGKYDYSQIEYINSHTDVKIKCPLHGYFWQAPANHYHSGCPRCGKIRSGLKQRKSTAEFISEVTKIHAGKYNYSKCEYLGNRTPIIIGCPIHGDFAQLPLNHIRYGCKKCGREFTSKKQTRLQEDFVEKAGLVHCNKFIYTKSQYLGSHHKLEIVCPIHGIFWQTANSHLRGRGCPKCKQGENHPRFGKPCCSGAYFGKYKGNTFRSMRELSWMLRAETTGIEYIALDQGRTRSDWQTAVVDENGKKRTYCPDFFIPKDKKIIDIKPVWRISQEMWKITPAKERFEKAGYIFEIVDCDTIPIDFEKIKLLWRANEIVFYPASEKMMRARVTRKK